MPSVSRRFSLVVVCMGLMGGVTVQAPAFGITAGIDASTDRELRGVALVKSNEAANTGSGTLISPEWVLTAGHVIDSGSTWPLAPKVTINGKNFAVDKVINCWDHNGTTDGNLKQVFNQPQAGDFALLHLSEPVPAEVADPIPLADSSETFSPGKAMAAGYGKISVPGRKGPSSTGLLLKTPGPVVPVDTGEGTFIVSASGRVIMLDDPNPDGSYHAEPRLTRADRYEAVNEGDSGGPLLVRDQNGKLRTAGAWSAGNGEFTYAANAVSPGAPLYEFLRSDAAKKAGLGDLLPRNENSASSAGFVDSRAVGNVGTSTTASVNAPTEFDDSGLVPLGTRSDGLKMYRAPLSSMTNALAPTVNAAAADKYNRQRDAIIAAVQDRNEVYNFRPDLTINQLPRVPSAPDPLVSAQELVARADTVTARWTALVTESESAYSALSEAKSRAADAAALLALANRANEILATADSRAQVNSAEESLTAANNALAEALRRSETADTSVINLQQSVLRAYSAAADAVTKLQASSPTDATWTTSARAALDRTLKSIDTASKYKDGLGTNSAQYDATIQSDTYRRLFKAPGVTVTAAQVTSAQTALDQLEIAKMAEQKALGDAASKKLRPAYEALLELQNARQSGNTQRIADATESTQSQLNEALGETTTTTTARETVDATSIQAAVNSLKVEAPLTPVPRTQEQRPESDPTAQPAERIADRPAASPNPRPVNDPSTTVASEPAPTPAETPGRKPDTSADQSTNPQPANNPNDADHPATAAAAPATGPAASPTTRDATPETRPTTSTTDPSSALSGDGQTQAPELSD